MGIKADRYKLSNKTKMRNKKKYSRNYKGQFAKKDPLADCNAGKHIWRKWDDYGGYESTRGPDGKFRTVFITKTQRRTCNVCNLTQKRII